MGSDHCCIGWIVFIYQELISLLKSFQIVNCFLICFELFHNCILQLVSDPTKFWSFAHQAIALSVVRNFITITSSMVQLCLGFYSFEPVCYAIYCSLWMYSEQIRTYTLVPLWTARLLSGIRSKNYVYK